MTRTRTGTKAKVSELTTDLLFALAELDDAEALAAARTLRDSGDAGLRKRKLRFEIEYCALHGQDSTEIIRKGLRDGDQTVILDALQAAPVTPALLPDVVAVLTGDKAVHDSDNGDKLRSRSSTFICSLAPQNAADVAALCTAVLDDDGFEKPRRAAIEALSYPHRMPEVVEALVGLYSLATAPNKPAPQPKSAHRRELPRPQHKVPTREGVREGMRPLAHKALLLVTDREMVISSVIHALRAMPGSHGLNALLADLEGHRAVPILEALLDSPDGSLRGIGARGLAKAGVHRVMPRLREMLEAQGDNPCAVHVTLSADEEEEPITKTFMVSGDIMCTAWVEVQAESDEEALRIAAGGQYDIDDIFDPHDFTPVEVVKDAC